MNDLEIKLCRKEDLDLLEKTIPSSGLSKFHQRRFKAQKEKGREYLIAWLDGKPVGNLDLRYDGFDSEKLPKDLRKVPELNAITVAEGCRGKGIGTALIKEGERRVEERGFKKVGLGVNPENEGAKRLYERLGYKDSGTGLHHGEWEVTDKDGNSFMESEEDLIYFKEL